MFQEQLLTQIIAQYPLDHPQMIHLGTLWNTTYRVVTKDETSYNLRVCNPLFQDRRCLHDELVFLDFVASRGQVQVPTPVPNRHGEFVTVLATPEGQRLSCLFTWLEGQEARGRLSAPALHQMGRSVALLHEAARAYAFPADGDGLREDYRYDESLVLSHREWIAERTSEIGAERVALLHRAIDVVLAALTDAGKRRDNYGFIHGDLHLGNFIVQGDRVSVIDFDQLGRGHFDYDIATLLSDLRNEPGDFDARWNSFQAGYQAAAARPFPDMQQLAPFVTAVDLTFLDWYYNVMTPSARAQYRQRMHATYESIGRRVDEA
jgi:Ser/Thr protein kinase RdoA (MazF antagonist)